MRNNNMKIKLIAAIDLHFGIGKDGNLLFKIPEDMKLFKQLTTDNIVLMGRKTFESIRCKPLPDRINIVISSTKEYQNEDIITFDNYEEALEFVRQRFPDKDLYIIGGGQVYRRCINFADEIILTRYNRIYEKVDTFFPKVIETEFREAETILKGSFEGIEFKTSVFTKTTKQDNIEIIK